MGLFKNLIDFFTLGSVRPVRRLVGYYVVLGSLTASLMYIFPVADRLFSGERMEELSRGPEFLQDGLTLDQGTGSTVELPPRLELAATTLLIMAGTLALMLPVTWVYMSVRRSKASDQSVVQTLIILPLVVAAIILIVRNSLALAFSLAGVVSAVRFRTTLQDARDVVFIFLAIAIGFSAGVQAITVGALASVVFNFVLLLVWRYDFGRNVLEPNAGTHWSEPLTDLAAKQGDSNVPDRDLVLALSPKDVAALSERFKRLGNVIGSNGKKSRFDAILSITTNSLTETQQTVERVLEDAVKRWKLDEVVTNQGKPSELYYLLRLGSKSGGKDAVLTEVRAKAGSLIEAADIELAETDSKKS